MILQFQSNHLVKKKNLNKRMRVKKKDTNRKNINISPNLYNKDFITNKDCK